MPRGLVASVPLPFDLPRLSRGYVALGREARATGDRAAAAAAASLSAVLGQEVTLRGRACPGIAAPRPASAGVAIALTALPDVARLEVDAGLVVALVAALAGGAAETGATALTPVEGAALELFALAVLDGACGVDAIDERLAPRLARDLGPPPSALAVELDVSAGPVRGHGRLLLPPAAVAALRDPKDGGPGLALRVPASVRSGAASLSRSELAALAPGDVVLLDPPAACGDALVLPGGACIRGRIEEGSLAVEEVIMDERNAQLPIRLEVELARVELPLSELARLEPGAALPLALDRRGLVTLRIGERAVGRGELVDVDGAVGVRVLSLEVAP
jgi:type III secretion protein Q